MIRKFEKNDINPVMQIWKNENIKAHKFISKEYWKNNYNYMYVPRSYWSYINGYILQQKP